MVSVVMESGVIQGRYIGKAEIEHVRGIIAEHAIVQLGVRLEWH